MHPPPDPATLRALAEGIAREAGSLLRDRTGSRLDVSTKSSGTDMVTEVDRASEALIVERLTAARPDDGVLGEEGTDTPGTTGVRWLVDPLDGTTNFLYGFPGFNVSIAAQHDGTTVAAAVYDVVRDELFSAALAGGASRDGAPITASDQDDLAHALLGTGFSYDAARRRRQALVLAEVLPEVRDIRRQGAAALDLCSVACGRLDAFYERGLAPWDRAAGGLIASEAGARMALLDGAEDGAGAVVVAAAPGIADGLLALLARTDVGSA